MMKGYIQLKTTMDREDLCGSDTWLDIGCKYYARYIDFQRKNEILLCSLNI